MEKKNILFYAPYHLKWVINKIDVYDYRFDKPDLLTHSEILKALKEKRDIDKLIREKEKSKKIKHKPGPKSCAELQICFDRYSAGSNWCPPHKISAAIDLPSASMRISADKHQSHPRIHSFIHAERNIMALRIKDNSHNPRKMTFKDGSRVWYGKPEWEEYYAKR